MSYNINAVQGLEASLRATGVLSDSYRQQIVQYAVAAYQEGYNEAKEKAEGVDITGDEVVTTNTVTAKAVLKAVVGEEFTPEVYIDYRDRHGDVTFDREVKVVEVNDGDQSVGVIDLSDDGFRRLYLDRIQKVAVYR